LAAAAGGAAAQKQAAKIHRFIIVRIMKNLLVKTWSKGQHRPSPLGKILNSAREASSARWL